MPKLEEHIQSLQQKMHLLVKKHQQLQKENNKLKEELKSLKENLSAHKHEFEIMEMQNAMLKATQQQLDDKEKKDMEKKINHYIREIDRCIALITQ